MNKRGKDIATLLEDIQLKDQHNNAVQLQDQSSMKHPMRAVFIALDMTKSIQMKDFKPSRLSIATQMIKHFIKKSQQQTPIIKFCFSVVEEEICKLKTDFTFDTQSIFEVIDMLKVQNNGFFSLQNVLRSALERFEGISNCFKKQLVIIQASSLTKDYRDIYQTMENLKQASIQVNIISLVGWTHVFQKLVAATKGKYQTVSSNQQFKSFVETISQPSDIIDDSIQKTMFKATLCKKQYNQKGVQCYCHFKKIHNYFVCGFCNGITCKSPPIDCAICKKLIILPTDLSKHKLTSKK